MTSYTQKVNRGVIDLFKELMTKISQLNDNHNDDYLLMLSWLDKDVDTSIRVIDKTIDSNDCVYGFILSAKTLKDDEKSLMLTITTLNKTREKVYKVETSPITKESTELYSEVSTLSDDFYNLALSIRKNGLLRSEAESDTEKNTLLMDYDIQKIL